MGDDFLTIMRALLALQKELPDMVWRVNGCELVINIDIGEGNAIDLGMARKMFETEYAGEVCRSCGREWGE